MASKSSEKNQAIEVGGIRVDPGERQEIDLPIAELYSHAEVHMPIEVVNGKKSGPVLFISAAIHGDEINGVEIVRRVLRSPTLNRIRGTLIAVPVVNVHGFLAMSRYLPDRRDLNRCFPGSERGSVAGRLAYLFGEEVVKKADCGIDLHTGSGHRANLPQIRANLEDPATRSLAEAFGAPVIMNSNLRDGSLREFAARCGIPMLLYEAGEALRFDETCIRGGVRGVFNVMRELGMLPKRRVKRVEPAEAKSSGWVRAEQSGIVRHHVALGGRVKAGDVLATISDPYGRSEVQVETPFTGLVIGRSNLPLVNEGDAIFHIARFEKSADAVQTVDEFIQVQDTPTLPVGTEPPVV